jgi:HD-GYP domain-containing protein (c-di-GMP phosphodiesterase class II)
MSDFQAFDPDRVRTAEVIASLSLATDLAMGFPLEHGLRSTLIAMGLCDRLEVDSETASQTYFLSLLFYVGCNAPVEVGWEVFGDDGSLTTYATPFRFGTRTEMAMGMLRAVAPPTAPAHVRVWRAARHFPGLAIGFGGVVSATCEIARMLTEELGLSRDVSGLFAYEAERWDGKGLPGGVVGGAIPLAVRIAHVASDAAFQRMLGDSRSVVDVIAARGGGAFDPAVTEVFTRHGEEILDRGAEGSLWGRTLASEPKPWQTLEGDAIDRALAAMGHFSDMGVPELVDHSAGVSQLCSRAAKVLSFDTAAVAMARRAAFIHDLGRVSVPMRIWQKTGSLSLDDWEQVRLHAYHTERVLTHSPFLAALAPVAGAHHERLDGSGYHRGAAVSSLHPIARLLAAADAYHAMTEPRPHRTAMSSGEAAETMQRATADGHFAADAVAAVLEVSGHSTAPIESPAGLTDREVQVVELLARGLQTKQVARALGISPKTADFHIQNSYRKMGVSTRAGATLFAMQHGLTTWENSR